MMYEKIKKLKEYVCTIWDSLLSVSKMSKNVNKCLNI